MKTAVIAGTFDPITNGHMDLINRTAKLFDKVYIAVVNNPDKKTMFTIDERKKFAVEACKKIPNVVVEASTGLLIDFVHEKKADVVVRGARNTLDFEYEYDLAQIYQMTGGVEVVILPSYGKNAHVSSSMVRELIAHGKDASDFIPFNM